MDQSGGIEAVVGSQPRRQKPPVFEDLRKPTAALFQPTHFELTDFRITSELIVQKSILM